MMEFKKVVYVAGFTFLGLLVSTLLHGAIEIWVLNLITGNMEAYGNSFVWQNWEVVHRIAGTSLWFAGFVVGLWLGIRYWRLVYVEKARSGAFSR